MSSCFRYLFIMVIAVFSSCALIAANQTDEGSNKKETSVTLNGIYNIYLEPHINGSLGSDYALVIPADEFLVERSLSKDYVVLDSVEEQNRDVKRYHQSKGFALFRTARDKLNGHDSNLNYIKNDIELFLTEQGNQSNVFFFDKNYSELDLYDSQCEGNIFSSTNGTGYFFLRKQKPKSDWLSLNRQSYFLIYYNFQDEYEIAKSQFQKILKYIYLISEGRVVCLGN